MKLVNSKDINALVDDKKGLGDLFQEEDHGPCFEVKIDRERGDMVFLVDSKEVFARKLSKMDESYITIEKIVSLIDILKSGNMKELKRALGMKVS